MNEGMDALWSLRELAEALGRAPRTGPDPGIFGIGIDSRRIRPGELFVALAGDPGRRFTTSARSTRDGHDFIGHAVANGAAAVLAHRPGDYAVPALLVDDTLDGLWQLGRAARRRLAGPVVAVTGSSGKTTFKSFASAALGAFSAEGSLNNHIGVPLSLALAPRAAAGGVFEIGTNHPGEIEPLARLVEPRVAVVLNVHPAHIGQFGSLEAIRREKLSIALALDLHGTLVRHVAVDSEHAGPTISFGAAADGNGRGPRADVRLVRLREDIASIETPAGGTDCEVPGGGLHRALSVAAVAATLVALGLPLERLQRLAAGELPTGRGNRIEVGGATIVDESYNANPASMAATLAAFTGEARTGRRIAILGEMAELGEDAARYHEGLAEHCAGLDGVFCVGEGMRALLEALPAEQRLGYAAEADADLVAHWAAEARPGDALLVKGSNGVFWKNGFVAALARRLGD